MKVEFTNKNHIGYLERLIKEDITQLKSKVNKREEVWSIIKFAQERDGFGDD